MSWQRALVTGGAGFIGSHICEALLREGMDVLAIDDLSTGREVHVPEGASFLQMDVRDEAGLGKAMKGVDVVFHNAANVSIRNSIDTFRADADNNILGTLSVIQAAIKCGVRKLIFASSMAVYGEAESLPISEEQGLHPGSPYGIGKLAAERYCLQMAGFHGMQAIVLRYFNTFGIRQTLTPYVGVITIFIHRIAGGQAPVIFGDGTQVRDFVAVEDVARANVLAMRHGKCGQILNIGSGRGTSVNEIASLILERMGSDRTPEHADPPPGEPGDSIADVRRAEELIGYRPRRDLSSEIDRIIEWNTGVESWPHAPRNDDSPSG